MRGLRFDALALDVARHWYPYPWHQQYQAQDNETQASSVRGTTPKPIEMLNPS